MVLNISWVLNIREFWIYSGNNHKILIFRGNSKKRRYVWSVYDLKAEFFFQLWTIFISCEFLEKVWETMRHPRYCLAHHLGISSNITNDTHFSTPSTLSTLAHQPPYPPLHTTNVLSPIIIKKVFNFQENERYILSSGIYLARRNIHTAHSGTDTISSLRPKLWKLISDKIKHASTLSAFKAKIKSWTINNCPSRLCKIFVKDFGFVEIFPSLYWISH